MRREDGQKDAEGRHIYAIEYDPNVEAGFPDSATHRVSFLDEHTLVDITEESLLHWRQEGEHEFKEEEDEDVVDIKNYVDKASRLEKALGVTFDESVADALEHSGLTACQQMAVAENIQNGIFMFRQELANVVAGKGDDALVEEHEILEVIEKIQKRQKIEKEKEER